MNSIHRTAVMGILNITPDSFSDGGRFDSPEQAYKAAKRMAAQGADLIDLGAQSTRPGATDVGADTELERLLPVLKRLQQARQEADLPAELLFSIDTFLAPVARACLEAGADWINDVSGGLADPQMWPTIADYGCPYVLMHRRGDARSMDSLAHYDDVVSEVETELLRLCEQALQAGVQPQQLVLDPGIGFAKTTEHNLELLRGLPRLQRLGYPLLVGPSRKRFIGEVLGESRPQARLWGTAASVCQAVAAGTAVVRVHDVGPIVQTCRMAEALFRPNASGTALQKQA